jgi:hypothetical protein
MHCLIAIPCFTESKRLPLFLDSLGGELAEAPFQTSMVIVDDGPLKRFRDGEIFLSWSYSNKV